MYIRKINRGEKISIKNTTLLISFALVLFILIGSVSAEDLNDTAVFQKSSDATLKEVQTASFDKVSKSNYLVNDTFEVTLLDGKNKAMSNRTVYFEVNDNVSDVLTDANGKAKFKLDLPKGTYAIKYIFNETGFRPVQGFKNILLLSKPVSSIKGTNMNVYAGFGNCMKIALTADGVPLAGRKVIVTLNKKSYTVKTNAKGVANFYFNVFKGTYNLKYRFAGEDLIKASSASSTIKAKVMKNPYGTKYMRVTIDADGGFTKAFLKDIAYKLSKCGWKVTVRGIGPGQHSKNYKKVYNGVYMPFYNGLCAATIKEMPAKYYGGVIKAHKSVLTPAWYTKDWVSAKMSQYRNDITKVKFLKRAWDDNFSPASYKGMNNPAQFMTKNKIRYCVGDTTTKLVEQFARGGWVACNK